MAENKQWFIIRKRASSYVVSVEGMETVVEPFPSQQFSAALMSIAGSLQISGNLQLALHGPGHPLLFLKGFYFENGWKIENAD